MHAVPSFGSDKDKIKRRNKAFHYRLSVGEKQKKWHPEMFIGLFSPNKIQEWGEVHAVPSFGSDKDKIKRRNKAFHYRLSAGE